MSCRKALFVVWVCLLGAILAAEDRYQTFFQHIIWSHIADEFSDKKPDLKRVAEVRHGKIPDGVERSFPIQRSPSGDKLTLVLSGDNRIDVRFQDEYIVEVEILKQGRRTRYSRFPLGLADGEPHAALSKEKLIEVFRNDNIFRELSKGSSRLHISLLALAPEGVYTVAVFRIRGEDFIRLISYRGDELFYADNFIPKGRKTVRTSWYRMAMTGRFYHLASARIEDRRGDGFYGEFFPNGLLRSLAESRNDKWQKQKCWSPDGAPAGEFVYPPGNGQKLTSFAVPGGLPSVRFASNGFTLNGKAEYRIWDAESNSAYVMLPLMTKDGVPVKVEIFRSQVPALLESQFETLKRFYGERGEELASGLKGKNAMYRIGDDVRLVIFWTDRVAVLHGNSPEDVHRTRAVFRRPARNSKAPSVSEDQ